MARNTREPAGSLDAVRAGSGCGLLAAAGWMREAAPSTGLVVLPLPPLDFTPLASTPRWPVAAVEGAAVPASWREAAAEWAGALARPSATGGAIVRRAVPVVGASSAAGRAVARPSAWLRAAPAALDDGGVIADRDAAIDPAGALLARAAAGLAWAAPGTEPAAAGTEPTDSAVPLGRAMPPSRVKPPGRIELTAPTEGRSCSDRRTTEGNRLRPATGIERESSADGIDARAASPAGRWLTGCPTAVAE
jgi:hypothetical protein